MIERTPRLFTAEEYLALDRASERKCEFINGGIYAMAGASSQHNIITGNVIAGLHSQLKGRPCQTYPSDMRVQVNSTGLYTYPDVTVVCGEPLFLDEQGDVLLNPTVIVEVLSPSTEAYDRGERGDRYRLLPSLTEYVVVAQDRHWVHHYSRQSDNKWLLDTVTALENFVVLPSIDCMLRLEDIYDKVSIVDTRLVTGASARPS